MKAENKLIQSNVYIVHLPITVIDNEAVAK